MQLTRRQWLDVFAHPAAVGTVLLIFTHQSIIAASSYVLTHLIENFQNGEPFQNYLYLYLAAMLIPYVPGCASFFFLQKWINDAHRALTTRLASLAFGRTERHRDASLRETVESVCSRNSFITLKDYLTFFHGFLGFLLNSMLSMIVLGLLLPGNLLVGYFLSLLLCAVVIALFRPTIAARSGELESRFVAYSDALASIWDNTTIGNRYHFRNWSDAVSREATSYYRDSNRVQLLKQAGNLLLAAASLGPTIYLVTHAILDTNTSPGLIAAIIVSLTRVFHILNSLSSLVYQLLDWSSMNARMRVLFDAEVNLSMDARLPEEPVGEITINGALVTKYTETAEQLKAAASGRFTIRGSNGAGKSTLLHVLKTLLLDEALLIPAHHGKLCWQKRIDRMSTGQRTLEQLREASHKASSKYLLLDEWDANLDQRNRRDIDEMLDQLSHDMVVVEIRH